MDVLFDMTVSSSVVLLAVMLLKLALKNRISPVCHMVIWFIPAVRMIVPRLPESHVSIKNLIYSPNLVNTTSDISGSIDISIGAENTIMAVWTFVSVILAAFFMISAARNSTKIRKMTQCQDPDVINTFKECCDLTKVNPDRFTVKTGSSSNMLAGIIKPVICISDGFAIEELKHVFVHELCHYRSRDIAVKTLWVILICIYWFNPLVWIGFRMLCRDMEIYCDYRAVKILGDRKKYSAVLLRSACGCRSVFYAGAAMVTDKNEVTARIKNIASFKKTGMVMSVFMAVMIILMSCLCLTDNVTVLKTDTVKTFYSAHTEQSDEKVTEGKYGELVILDLEALSK